MPDFPTQSQGITRDEFWFYTIAIGGTMFCSVVLFVVPALQYEQFPLMLAFDLWLACVITSMGVWVAMSVLQDRLRERMQ